jgi:hypothetical protein
MAVLTTQQRNTLEAAVKNARNFSEKGAYNALKNLAVHSKEAYAHMDAEQKTLRNSLRAKARLLGDKLEANGEQQIHKLAYELAYETWHKMLFAKFLEVNNLLMHPDGVSVSFHDIEELFLEEGFANKWDAAAHYASRMLPAIFRIEDPVMQVHYAPDDRIKLEEIIENLEKEIFLAEDALGWVYQFWQSEAKAAINASGDKIDGEKLPAVTQLFTEPYMVNFLIDNTLGAWWVSRNPGVQPPVKFDYLRLLDDGTPAAGKFEGWPDKTAEVTSLDPCMGSGHFIVSLFNVFVQLRMHEEGLSPEEATDRVIAENLHGLEIDPRCTQIAAFNLALAAWKFCGNKYKELPEMNLACSGIAPKGKKEDWLKLVRKETNPELKQKLENGISQMYDHFQLAPELGSLLDPTIIKPDAFTASFEELQPVLKKALENEADTEQMERGVMAAGIAKAGQLLAKKYHLIITNFPFLGGNRMSDSMYLHCQKYYPASFNELATVFFERSNRFTVSLGLISAVSPHYWMRLKTSSDFRIKLLKFNTLKFIVDLGGGAFSNISGEVVKVCLSFLQNKLPNKTSISAIDLNLYKSIYDKVVALQNDRIINIEQSSISKRKGAILALEVNEGDSVLGDFANVYKGLDRADVNRFVFRFTEVVINRERHKFIQTSFDSAEVIAGKTNIIDWTEYVKYSESNPVAIRGDKAWNKRGLAVKHTGKLPISLYLGELYDTNVHAIIPKKAEFLSDIWKFCFSEEFNEIVRKYDTKIGVTNAVFEKIPFKLNDEYNTLKGFKEFIDTTIFTENPTQWLFHGHPIKTENPLQVALARMLGYRWPAETDTEMELAEEARELIKDVKAFDHFTDNDGIVCIPTVNREAAFAERLREYLQVVFQDQWDYQTITNLLENEGAKSRNLEDWLRNEFFEQHCKVFKNRPFIWHIWDGRRDGFSALVNYHKLTKDNLSKLIYVYLGDWIRQCEAKKEAGESGAEGLLSAALILKGKLVAILQGEAPYDIFVRWKPLEEQPIGWEPDLNDGVRLNIRPFITADVLRVRLHTKIKYGIDRGKNPPGSPWGEVRVNDRHLSLEEKRTAREKTTK